MSLNIIHLSGMAPGSVIPHKAHLSVYVGIYGIYIYAITFCVAV